MLGWVILPFEKILISLSAIAAATFVLKNLFELDPIFRRRFFDCEKRFFCRSFVGPEKCQFQNYHFKTTKSRILVSITCDGK